MSKGFAILLLKTFNPTKLFLSHILDAKTLRNALRILKFATCRMLEIPNCDENGLFYVIFNIVI